MSMKRLKSLVFLVFLMALGVGIERVSMIVYEWGTKVDWQVVKRALFEEHNREATPIAKETDVAMDTVPVADPIQTTDRGVPLDQPGTSCPQPSNADIAEPQPVEQTSANQLNPPEPAYSASPAEPPAATETSSAKPIEPIPEITTFSNFAKTVEQLAATETSSAKLIEPIPEAIPEITTVSDYPKTAITEKLESDFRRVVCRLEYASAAATAQSLSQVFSQSGVAYPAGCPNPNPVIVPETTSNSLLISGPKDEVQKVLKMVDSIDQQATATMVKFEIRLMEVDSSIAKKIEENPKGELDAAAVSESGYPLLKTTLLKATLATLDNQATELAIMQQVPEIGASMSGPNGRSNTVTSAMLGTQINLTPRVMNDKAVMLSVKFKDCRHGSQEDAVVVSEPKDAPAIKMPVTDTLSTETTVHLESGKPIVLNGVSRSPKSGKECLLIITAEVIRSR
jgi:hypothetical protein